MPTVSPDDIRSYRKKDYLLIENALTPDELSAIRAAVDGFIEKSRSLTQHSSAIELEAGHTADKPKVPADQAAPSAAPRLREAVPKLQHPGSGPRLDWPRSQASRLEGEHQGRRDRHVSRMAPGLGLLSPQQ
jgi:hypothetical protein